MTMRLIITETIAAAFFLVTCFVAFVFFFA